MNTRIKHFVLTLLLLTTLNSCTKETLLSCDPYTNNWAKEKLSYYENAGRNELLQLSIAEQRAIINGMSGTKRVSLWHEKLEIIKSENLLSPEELSIYEETITYMKDYHFENPKKSQDLISFIESKLIILYENYNWDEKKEFYYYHTWLTESEYNDAILYELIHQSSTDPDDNINSKDCSCRSSRLECSAGMICTEGNCNKVLGCGIVNMSNCIGICKG